MENLDSLLKLVDNEIEAVNKNGKFRSRDDVDLVYKLIDIAKDVYCIWDYEEGAEGEGSYAYNGGSYARGGRSYNYGGSDGSYARGRRGARRDSMGRYSRYDGGMRGYSRDGGKEEYLEHLRDMMEDAPDEETRSGIQRMISKMEKSM